MNSCILIAQIISNPELRYTQDTQTAVCNMVVEFQGLRPDDPPATLKVVGWGNVASDIHTKFVKSDRVILEGRLNINNFDRPEGFKEKRAELTVSKIYHLNGDNYPTVYGAVTETTSAQPTPTSAPNNVVPMQSSKPKEVKAPPTPVQETPRPVVTPAETVETDLDEIPF